MCQQRWSSHRSFVGVCGSQVVARRRVTGCLQTGIARHRAISGSRHRRELCARPMKWREFDRLKAPFLPVVNGRNAMMICAPVGREARKAGTL